MSVVPIDPPAKGAIPMQSVKIPFLGLLSFCLTVSLSFTAQSAELTIGQAVPEFSALDDQGKSWKLSEHTGEKFLVVYFYPADMTGGCTKQACGFRDDSGKLQELNAEVVGVSGDSVENHQLFKSVHQLNFTLLSDSEGSVAKVFGVSTRPGGSIKRVIEGKSVTLTRSVTTNRWTFVIAPDGSLIYKNTKVNAAKDSEEIIKLLSSRQSK